MIFNIGKKHYKVIRDVLDSKANSVYVCQRQDTSVVEYKTVWVVKDRNLSRRLLKICSQADVVGYESCFSYGNDICFLFPYVEEREAENFFLGTVRNGSCSKEQICLEYVTKCMTSRLPDALMYMLLEQNQVQLMPDGSIYFNFFLDLTDAELNMTNRKCVRRCAQNILNLLKLDGDDKNPTQKLIEKELERTEYTEYIQLYKDLKLMAKEEKRGSLIKRLGDQVKNRKDMIFKVLSVIAVILVVIVLMMLLMRLLFGSVTIFDLFRGPIKQIGTESLLQ